MSGQSTQQETSALEALIASDWTRPAPPGRDVPVRQSLDEMFEAEPARTVGSFSTVAVLFLVLAVVQVGLLSIAAGNFDLSGLRFTLIYVLGAPALLYGVIAAWDQRQLIASGHPNPPTWVLALLCPPLYLAVRAIRGGGNRPPRSGVAFGWVAAQLAVSIAFAVIATTALVNAPNPPAEAEHRLTPAETARLLTADGIEQAVEQDWIDRGLSGEVECPEPVEPAAGVEVDCRGVVDGRTIDFTVLFRDAADGQRPWTIASWVQAPQA